MAHGGVTHWTSSGSAMRLVRSGCCLSPRSRVLRPISKSERPEVEVDLPASAMRSRGLAVEGLILVHRPLAHADPPVSTGTESRLASWDTHRRAGSR